MSSNWHPTVLNALETVAHLQMQQNSRLSDLIRAECTFAGARAFTAIQYACQNECSSCTQEWNTSNQLGSTGGRTYFSSLISLPLLHLALFCCCCC